MGRPLQILNRSIGEIKWETKMIFFFVFDATRDDDSFECAVRSERLAHFIAWALTLLTGRCHDFHSELLGL